MAILNAMFFDIGNTLGEVHPETLQLRMYADMEPILRGVHALGLRVGVITNVARDVTKERVRTMLRDAGILDVFEDAAIVTSTEAGTFKPDLGIYQYAARMADLEPQRCIYVGEDPVQVAAAIAAGMHGILKN